MYPSHTILADRNRHLGESAMQLHCFIANSINSRSSVRQEETTRTTLVSARENSRMIAMRQEQLHNISCHRRFSRSTHRNITHTDCRHLYGKRRDDTLVEQQMTNRHSYRVQPTQRNIENVSQHLIRING